MTTQELRDQALSLPAEERELLGGQLLCSLESTETQVEIDAAWEKEILARSDAYQRGNIKAFDAAGTVDRIRQRLAERQVK